MAEPGSTHITKGEIRGIAIEMLLLTVVFVSVLTFFATKAGIDTRITRVMYLVATASLMYPVARLWDRYKERSIGFVRYLLAGVVGGLVWALAGYMIRNI